MNQAFGTRSVWRARAFWWPGTGGTTVRTSLRLLPALAVAGLLLGPLAAASSAGESSTDDSFADFIPRDFKRLHGTSHADRLRGTAGKDFIRAYGGADTSLGRRGMDVVSGGDGVDAVVGGQGSDFVWGGGGRDATAGGPAADLVYEFAGADTVDGGPGADWVGAGMGSDVVRTSAGPDFVIAFSDRAADVIRCGAGEHDIVDYVRKPDPRDRLIGCEHVDGRRGPHHVPPVLLTLWESEADSESATKTSLTVAQAVRRVKQDLMNSRH